MKDAMRREAARRIVETAAPVWVLDAARSGRVVKGPNGNEAVAYEWKWKWEIKHSARDDSVEAKASDWNAAEICATCGRKVVHVFWVRDAETKRTLPFGSEHVHIALGYARSLTDAQKKALAAKIATREEAGRRVREQKAEMERLVHAAEKKAVSTDLPDPSRAIHNAARTFNIEHNAVRLSRDDSNNVFFWHQQRKLLWAPKEMSQDKYAAALLPHGWTGPFKASEMRAKLA